MLFQSGALFDSMNVEENIAFPLREAGVKDEKEIRERVAEALEMVDLAGEQKKMPENSQRRHAQARRPRARPSSPPGLHPLRRADHRASTRSPRDSINHLIRRLQKRLTVTSVVVTHDMKTAFHTADQIAFLHEGRIYFHGTADELRASADPVIQDFIEGRSGESD